MVYYMGTFSNSETTIYNIIMKTLKQKIYVLAHGYVIFDSQARKSSDNNTSGLKVFLFF